MWAVLARAEVLGICRQLAARRAYSSAWQHDGDVAQVPGVAQHLVHYPIRPLRAGLCVLGGCLCLGARAHERFIRLSYLQHSCIRAP